MARVGSTNFKITKMAGYAKEIDVVDESDEEIQRVLQEKDAQNTEKSTKFAIQAFRAFGDLQTAEEGVENLDKRLARCFADYFFIFCMNILVFRYNISFIDPPLGGFGEIFPSVMIFPSGSIITSGNISPNPPRSGSINDKY